MIRIKSEDIQKSAKVLDLGETATMNTIKKKYKELIIKWHPDKCHDNQEKEHHETWSPQDIHIYITKSICFAQHCF